MDTRPGWQRLLHRELVQYNPLYLLSAALVLGGVHLLYGELAAADYVWGQLGVTAITEVYAWALIAGAALLTRLDLRRPAVLLALLVVLYQGDLTLVAERSVHLQGVGVVTAMAWLLSFALKLAALAWAVRVQPSRATFAVPMLGAVGLVVMPRLLVALAPATASALAGAWLFTVFCAGAWTHRTVTADDVLDDEATTKLRRTVTATWAIWAIALAAHVLFWSAELRLDLRMLAPFALLACTRWLRRELWTWAAAAASLALAASWQPTALWVVALGATATFALRALRRAATHDGEEAPDERPARGPYRQPDGDRDRDRAARPSPQPAVQFVRAPVAAQQRLLTGAAATLYLAVWTFGWSGEVIHHGLSLPAHVLVLDLAATLAGLLAAYRLRLRLPLAAVVVIHAHHVVASGLVDAPATRLGWGITAVVMGFVLLGGSLAFSYRWHRQTRASTAPVAD